MSTQVALDRVVFARRAHSLVYKQTVNYVEAFKEFHRVDDEDWIFQFIEIAIEQEQKRQ